jgi:hypothetical protein
MTAELVIDVVGEAIPQGSKAPVSPAGRRSCTRRTSGSPRGAPRSSRRPKPAPKLTGWVTLDGPVEVLIDFYLPRPKSVPAAARGGRA